MDGLKAAMSLFYVKGQIRNTMVFPYYVLFVESTIQYMLPRRHCCCVFTLAGGSCLPPVPAAWGGIFGGGGRRRGEGRGGEEEYLDKQINK